MSTLSYPELFEEMKKIANHYSLASMLEGFNAELINLHLTNHIDQLVAAHDYDTTEKMLNHAGTEYLKENTPFPMDFFIDDWITKELDRQLLYDYFKCWRAKLIAEEDVMAKIAMMERTGVAGSLGERKL